MSPLRTPRSFSAFAKRSTSASSSRVGDVALVALLAAPVVGDAVAATGLDVTVEAVVGDVQLCRRRTTCRTAGSESSSTCPTARNQSSSRGLTLPPALPVGLRLRVDRRIAQQRVLAKLRRRLEALDLEQPRELLVERHGGATPRPPPPNHYYARSREERHDGPPKVLLPRPRTTHTTRQRPSRCRRSRPSALVASPASLPMASSTKVTVSSTNTSSTAPLTRKAATVM